MTDHKNQRYWRHEIDGLRTIAITLVIAFHFWGAGVSGGVDVFFVLSGYLLIQTLLRHHRSPSGFQVFSYWSRTFLRLWAPVGIVVSVVAAASVALLPASRWSDLVSQFKASALGVQNMWLAHISVDYYAANSVATSPVQHLWSLSLQAQIFVALPLFFLTVWRLVGRSKHAVLIIAAMLFVTTIVSLWHGHHSVLADPVPSYFWTSTRIWEFTLGGLAACVPSLVASRRSAWICDSVSWMAIVVIVAGPFLWSPEARFPGLVALVPTCASAVFLIATNQPHVGAHSKTYQLSCTQLLGTLPFRLVGRQALGLYLWHWPLLIFYSVQSGQTRISALAGAVILVASFAASWVTTKATRGLELGVRRVRWGRPVGLAAVAAVTAATIASTHVLQTSSTVDNTQPRSIMEPTPNRTFTHSDGTIPDVIFPRPGDVKKEWFDTGSLCTNQQASQRVISLNICRDPNVVPAPRYKWALVGDSHIRHFGFGIALLAKENDASMRTYLLGGCRYPDFPTSGRGFPECGNFVSAVREELKVRRPDVVFMVGTRGHPDEPGESLVPGLPEAAAELAAVGIHVVLFRDNPRFKTNPYECGELRGWNHESCVNPLPSRMAGQNPLTKIASSSPKIHTVDTLSEICPQQLCSPLQGNIAVFVDDNHLSRPFSEALLPSLRRQLSGTGVLTAEPQK